MTDEQQRKERDERDAIDQITHGLLAASLLSALMDLLVEGKQNEITVGDFYRQWSETHQSDRFVPFNGGVVLAYMYLGILLPHENWPDLVPEEPLSAWDITPLRLEVPEQPNRRDLRYVVKRIRHSLAHGRPKIHVPQGITPENFESKVTITFFDKNMKKPSDTFEIELTLRESFHLARRLHQTVCDDAGRRFGVMPPASKPQERAAR